MKIELSLNTKVKTETKRLHELRVGGGHVFVLLHLSSFLLDLQHVVNSHVIFMSGIKILFDNSEQAITIGYH